MNEWTHMIFIIDMLDAKFVMCVSNLEKLGALGWKITMWI
jgi:hypothetical protein